MEKIEIKIILYVLFISIIMYIIAKIKFQKSNFNWEFYKKNNPIAFISIFLFWIICIYLFGRIILIPFSIWFFNN